MVDGKYDILDGVGERKSRQWPILLISATLRERRICCPIPASCGHVAVRCCWNLCTARHYFGLRQARAACALRRDRFGSGGNVRLAHGGRATFDSVTIVNLDEK